MLLRTASMMTAPQRQATSSLRLSTCGTAAVPMGERPISSITVAMVLAVNWPPQAPAPGQAWSSISSSSASLILPRGVGADGFEDVLNGDVVALVNWPGRMEPP